MPEYNMWLSVSQEMKNELKGWILDDPPTEPVQFPLIMDLADVTMTFFQSSYDTEVVEKMYRTWDAAGRTYSLWSVYAVKPQGTQQVKADLDMLIAAYPQDFSVSGSWSFDDGSQVGPEGDPWYPIPPQLINFMPLIFTPGPNYPDDENDYTWEEPTELTDVNLLAGQAPRDFTQY